MSSFKKTLENNPVVAAVKNEKQLENALNSNIEIIFVLFGNILNVAELSEKIHGKNKIGIIHVDLLDGLSNREFALKFLRQKTKFHGIISTKPTMVKIAKKLGFIAIQRVFIIDSLAKKDLKNHMVQECDAIEMLPGVIFKVIKELSKEISKPIITGGLISDKDDILQAIEAGATCISTTNEELWKIK